MSLGLELPCDSAPWGRVACARQDDPDTCYLVFQSESVAWKHLGYFLTNGTTLHLRVELDENIILRMIDLNYVKVND